MSTDVQTWNHTCIISLSASMSSSSSGDSPIDEPLPQSGETAALLVKALPFCDRSNGLVTSRIPSELMTQLREAKLALGIGGKRRDQTETTATWFVFFDETIREEVMKMVRDNRKRRRRAKRKQSASETPKRPQVKRGLGDFLKS